MFGKFISQLWYKNGYGTFILAAANSVSNFVTSFHSHWGGGMGGYHFFCSLINLPLGRSVRQRRWRCKWWGSWGRWRSRPRCATRRCRISSSRVWLFQLKSHEVQASSQVVAKVVMSIGFAIFENLSRNVGRWYNKVARRETFPLRRTKNQKGVAFLFQKLAGIFFFQKSRSWNTITQLPVFRYLVCIVFVFILRNYETLFQAVLRSWRRFILI